MKKSVCLAGMAPVLLSVFLAWNAASYGAAKSKVCPGVNYQADRCDCKPGQKCEGCPCAACTGGDKCPCIEAVRKSSGSIAGDITIYRTRVKTSGPKSDKDVVVYLEKVGDNDFPPPLKNAVMDQKSLNYVPHVLAVQKGTKVTFLNTDNTKHNVYFVNDKTGKTKDLGTWQPGQSRSYTFGADKETVKRLEKTNKPDVMIALCKLHLDMAAYIVTLPNPFFVTASIDGATQKATYTIKNVPPGKYKLNIWHKKLKLRGGARDVVVEVGKSSKCDIQITKAAYANKK
jgi:plastocyanin